MSPSRPAGPETRCAMGVKTDEMPQGRLTFIQKVGSCYRAYILCVYILSHSLQPRDVVICYEKPPAITIPLHHFLAPSTARDRLDDCNKISAAVGSHLTMKKQENLHSPSSSPSASLDRALPIPGLLLTSTVAFTLLGLKVNGWKGSENFANFITDDRTTVAIAIQIISHILGLIQVQALCKSSSPPPAPPDHQKTSKINIYRRLDGRYRY